MIRPRTGSILLLVEFSSEWHEVCLRAGKKY